VRMSAWWGVDESDDALLLAAAGGDEGAFERFYRRHLPVMTGFHLRRTGQPELAFDLTAETFAAVVVSLDRFDPELGGARSWLFVIAANKLRDSVRRRRVEDEARRRLRHERIVLTDEDLARVEALADEGDEEQVSALLDDLPELQREAVVSRVLQERPYAEIAVGMACSEAVVRQRVRRGLLTLRNRLERERPG